MNCIEFRELAMPTRMRGNIRLVARLVCVAALAATAWGQAGGDRYTKILSPTQSALKPLVDTDTLVTVVLKTGAQDANLRIVGAAPDYFAFRTSNGEREAYPYTLVKEIRVQRARLDVEKFQYNSGLMLRGGEQEVISRAIERAREIFQTANDNQNAKMIAAAIMAADGDEAGRTYLEQLASTNNMEIALEAASNLYLGGAGSDVDSTLIEKGLTSGSRKLRAKAAQLAGLLQVESAIPTLRIMMVDRSPDLSAPAIRSLGQLHDDASVPEIVDALKSLDEARGEAAVAALSDIGGLQVIDLLKRGLDSTEGQIWLRYVRVLFNLDDPLGAQLLRDKALRVPGLDREAALLLVTKGDWEASEFLRQHLQERNDPNLDNLTYKARAAAAAVTANYPPAVSELSRLVRLQENDVLALGTNAAQVKKDIVKKVRIFACNRIAQLGYPNLMTILQPPIESLDVDTALAACEAALSIADASFRERLTKLMEW